MGHAVGSSFQPRLIDLVIKLDSGTFDGDADTVRLTGLRCEVEIDEAGLYTQSGAHVRVWGVAQNTMDRLTLLSWHAPTLGYNVLEVFAGTNEADMSLIFSGNIFSAMPNFQGAPEVSFEMEAQSGLVKQLATDSPLTFGGTNSVASIMGVLAKGLGVTLENNGVTGSLTDMYLGGTLLDKVNTIAQAAGIDYYYDEGARILAICPRGMPRNDDAVLISEGSGLVGWPQITKQGVDFTVLHNPSITRGKPLWVESSRPNVNGGWYAYAMAHRLHSQVPGGPWFTHISASRAQNVVRAT